MAKVLDAPFPAQQGSSIKERALPPTTLWQRLALGAIIAISLFMNFFELGQNGFGDSYYAAGVRSMLDSWHNFFFVSFDPGGFVTLDKPPLGFWLQVLSAKIFGFTAFSVYLPQALAGVLSVALLYHLVRRHFGVVAGLLAALALALSPISIVTSRNNTVDSTLALVLLLGAWTVLRAAETGRLRWLLLCAATIGIGFNIKMLEAYLVVPAFGLLYLLAAPKSIWKRIGDLSLAAILLLAISLSWVLAVDLTPASQRPYVDSSQNNSEISLALGYNGINRLTGQLGMGPGGPPPGQPTNTGGNPPQGAGPSGGPGSSGGPGGPGDSDGLGGNGLFNTGTPGPLRLFTEPLGGQIVWLLPLAILGMLALAWQSRPRFQSDRQQQSLILWGTWLLTMGIFFSVAGFFHQYYLTEMAPAIAALFGIGIVTMWHDYRLSGWRGWLLPLVLIATALEQIYILSSYLSWSLWLAPIIAVLCIAGSLVLIVMRIMQTIEFNRRQRSLSISIVSIALLGLMITPTTWAAIPVIQNIQSQLPVAGPSQQGDFGGPGGPGGPNGNPPGFRNPGAPNGASTDTALINYLEAHQGNAKFLVATPDSMEAGNIILATNKPVMSLGGFSGGDPILTVGQLEKLIHQGTIRYFLLNSFGPGQQPPSAFLKNVPEQDRDRLRNGSFGGGPRSSLTSWVKQHCTAVSSMANQLYDCAAMH
jgi:4-amino-4-deoxy-L-arabinose transferase-like glycosyltransferase